MSLNDLLKQKQFETIVSLLSPIHHRSAGISSEVDFLPLSCHNGGVFFVQVQFQPGQTTQCLVERKSNKPDMSSKLQTSQFIRIDFLICKCCSQDRKLKEIHVIITTICCIYLKCGASGTEYLIYLQPQNTTQLRFDL